MAYCYCTATVGGAPVIPPTANCDGCLNGRPIVVGCNQGLLPCGDTTDIDLQALLKNTATAVYSIRTGYDVLVFTSAVITAAGVLSITTGEKWEPHKLYEIEYQVVDGKYKAFGTVYICIDNPCDEGCVENCNYCNGTCYGNSTVLVDTADCASLANTIDISPGLTLAACDGVTTFDVTSVAGLAATIDAAGVITYDVDNVAVAGQAYVMTWTASCSKYGMIATGTVTVTINSTDCGGCLSTQYCDYCTGTCEDLESDLGSEGTGFGSSGAGSGTTIG